MHPRFKRTVYTSRESLCGSLARWLVMLSPYTVPDNLEVCIKKFHKAIDDYFDFDSHGFIKVYLANLDKTFYELLENIPEVMALNEPRNPELKDIQYRFVDRYSPKPNPDDDFIDIMAVAQNMVCDLATEADKDEYLKQQRELVYVQHKIERCDWCDAAVEDDVPIIPCNKSNCSYKRT